MSLVMAAVVAGATALDELVGEPPTTYHPVGWFGHLISRVDRVWLQPLLLGVVIAIVLPIGAALLVGLLVAGAFFLDTIIGVVVSSIGLALVTSRRQLIDIATHVVDLSTTDPTGARAVLPALVGREVAALNPDLQRSAAIESAAENLSDGFIAPLLGFALVAPFSIPAGIAVATWVKAINTLDSMLGYQSVRHGTGSARLDDIVMWVPARVTAALIASVARHPGALWKARSIARIPASPNAGWPMGTLAIVANIRLEKPGVYTLNANAPLPDVTTGHHAIGVVHRAALLALALVIGWSFVAAVGPT